MNAEKFPTYGASETSRVRRLRKRERYTRVACKVCKARKVKCSGDLPCSRCMELKIECKYQLSDPAYPNGPRGREIEGQFSSPQQGLPQLLSTMKRVCDDIQSSTSHLGAIRLRGPLLRRRHSNGYDGPSRSKRTHSQSMNAIWPPFDLIQAFLKDQETALPNNNDQEAASQMTSKEIPRYSDMSTITFQAARPLLEMGYDAVRGHLTNFEHEVFPIHPCISMEIARSRVDALFSDSSHSTRVASSEVNVDLIDIELMKVVTAISMLLRSDDDNLLISDVESHLIWNVDDVTKQENVQVEDIIMASLMTIYFIVKDQLIKAWRMCSLAARSCLELGLHKDFPVSHIENDIADLEILTDIFNCVYNLDRRISFTTAMPWSLRDEDIDEKVFDLKGRHPYLSTMVTIDRVLSEIWSLRNSSPGLELKAIDERVDFLAYRLEKLVDKVQNVKYSPLDSSTPVPPASTQEVMQHLVLLRVAHIKMLAQIKCINAPEAFSCQSQAAHSLLSLAIGSVNHNQNIFLASGDHGVSRLIRFLIHRLLKVSVSVIIMAASYNSQVYGPRCRKAFHVAIDLLSMSRSTQSDQASNTIISCSLADLRKIGERIHMPAESNPFASSVEPLLPQGEPTILQPSHPAVSHIDYLSSYANTDQDFGVFTGDICSNWDFQLDNTGIPGGW